MVCGSCKCIEIYTFARLTRNLYLLWPDQVPSTNCCMGLCSKCAHRFEIDENDGASEAPQLYVRPEAMHTFTSASRFIQQQYRPVPQPIPLVDSSGFVIVVHPGDLHVGDNIREGPFGAHRCPYHAAQIPTIYV